MIGAINKTYKMKDLKEISSFRLSGTIINRLNDEMQKNKVSKSEIVEFALRKIFNIDTEKRINPLNEIYK